MKKENTKRGLAAMLVFSMGAGMIGCGSTDAASGEVKYYRANYQENLPDTFENLQNTPVLNGDTVYFGANNEDYTKYGIYSYNLKTEELKTYYEEGEGSGDGLQSEGMNVDRYAVDSEGNIYIYADSWKVDTSNMKDYSNATLDDVLHFMVDSFGFEDLDAARKDWEKYYAKDMKQQEEYLDANGNIDYEKLLTEWNFYNLERTHSYCIKKLDAEGNEVYNNVLKQEENKNSYVMDIKAGKDDMLFLYLNEYSDDGMSDEYYITAYDSSGTQKGKCVLDSYGDSLITLADGNVGALVWNLEGTGYSIFVLDPNTMSISKEISLGGSYVERIQPLDEENFLMTENGVLYKFNSKTQKKEEYLNWVDCNISSNSVRGYQQLEDGSLLVITESYDYGTYQSKTELAFVEEIPAEEAAKIQTITLACINSDEQLESRVIELNKKNPQTRIHIKQYWEDIGEMDYEDAIAGFVTAMASDPNTDMIYFNGLSPYADMMNFAAKGLLIDLNPFLESDTEVKREDLMSSILDVCTYDEKLVGMPNGFSVRTVIGKVSDVGEEPGWTFEEMKALLESKEPGTQLFYGRTRDWALEMCMNLGYQQFIDMENATCSFESQEFIDILEFANLFPEEFKYEEGVDETTLMNTGKVLLADYSVSDFAQIQLYTEIFGDELTYIGYPTTEGNGALLSVGPCFSITKNCEDAEMAWKLIRQYYFPVAEESHHYYSSGMSVRQDAFDKFCEEAMSEENNGTWGWGSFEVEIVPATQEQVDEVKDLIANVTAVEGAVSSAMMNMIKEEAAAYFSGQKSAEEVAKIIQSRMQVYLSETE